MKRIRVYFPQDWSCESIVAWLTCRDIMHFEVKFSCLDGLRWVALFRPGSVDPRRRSL
jgi:hypothetical protein